MKPDTENQWYRVEKRIPSGHWVGVYGIEECDAVADAITKRVRLETENPCSTYRISLFWVESKVIE